MVCQFVHIGRTFWEAFKRRQNTCKHFKSGVNRYDEGLERKAHTKLGMLALLRLSPKTGRTHQLRVQCAKRKLPIIGDRTYGNFQLNRKYAKQFKCDRLFLHATKLKVKISQKGKTEFMWEVVSPLPPKI